jgi:hypothetical protein
LWRTTTTQLRRWLPQIDNRPDRPLFPSIAHRALTRPAVTARLRLAVHQAAAKCPSLSGRRVSPHCVRHYAGYRTMPTSRMISASKLCVTGDLVRCARPQLGIVFHFRRAL